MARKGEHKPRPAMPGADDPQGLGYLIDRFLDWLTVRGFSPVTRRGREQYLRYFAVWCGERGITKPVDVGKPVLERYQRHLFHYRKADGKPLTYRSQVNQLTPVRVFFRWLARNHHILINPAADLDMPRPEKRLPKDILTASEAEQIIAQVNLKDPCGIRDRAIMEVLYSTGMRRQELVNLKIFDLDLERGTVYISQGKGKKDRIIPIGERALAWVRKYLEEFRPKLAGVPDNGYLFLSRIDGKPFPKQRLSHMMRRAIKASGVGKQGACHIFRHTMATLMLEGGADIRYVQQMLGHVKLETTEIYTRVSMRKLKEVHSQTHPGASLKGRRDKNLEEE